MLRFIDLETPPNRKEDVQIAGLKPLPINRMVKQAGREVNRYTTTGKFGKPFRDRNNQIMRNPDGTPQLNQTRPTNDWDYYEKGDGRIPPDMKQRLIERQQRTKEVINNWDPIEASAKEDYNRLKGGRRGPLPTPSSGLEMIETIDTPSNPSQSVQQIITPGV